MRLENTIAPFSMHEHQQDAIEPVYYRHHHALYGDGDFAPTTQSPLQVMKPCYHCCQPQGNLQRIILSRPHTQMAPLALLLLPLINWYTRVDPYRRAVEQSAAMLRR
jgi:hypothetical protein